ncbi:MAG: LarC family nickel insertion protein [Planctomycetes bacterium]|nr:LarC family nickel insertion protein [Planctomycetota bacterium]
MRIAYFDCSSGASGDMILSGLLDAGFPFSKLKASLQPLIKPFKVKLSLRRVERCGLSGLKIDITGADAHLSLNEISGAIRKSRLPKQVKTDSLKILNRIADAETKVHQHLDPVRDFDPKGQNIVTGSYPGSICRGHKSKHIRLHELGSVDTLIDIVGSSLGIYHLGIERIYVSPLPLNEGKVRCAHGLYPLPAPGTMELLKNFELFRSPIKKELVTPTGAAILTTLGRPSNEIPQFNISKIGYGAGTLDLLDQPNILRVFIGTVPTLAKGGAGGFEKDTICVLETNIDNATGEVIGYTVEKLFAAGALDVFTLPIQMKKSRPGVLLQALCPIDLISKMEGIIFTELPTLGIRKYLCHRAKLKREIRSVKTKYGVIRVKVSYLGSEAQHLSPEYEDCRKAARKHNVPLRQVTRSLKNDLLRVIPL